MLAARGIDVTCETSRQWTTKFGTAIAANIRRARPRADNTPLTTLGKEHACQKTLTRLPCSWYKSSVSRTVVNCLLRPNQMKEKELRLALVYYGGVSLAIYQHGVNIEILNLIRASKAYHAPRSFAQKQADSHVYANSDGSGEPWSTEAVYFDLLKTIGKSLDLRVVVDVISGSSAGGINGIVLARAIAHDLSLTPLTDMWFTKADILQLIAPSARAGSMSKWYIAPFLHLAFARMEKEGVLPRKTDKGMRKRLSTFFRSRWFKPPFDGPHFSRLLLDGLMAMEGTQHSTSTLLPSETRLDLMITVTDYHGAEKLIFMHDPPSVREREHRQMLRFGAARSAHSLSQSDFSLGNVPALAFAGRASASYPGAFPPAQIGEMDAIVAERGFPWPDREQFLATNFAHYRQIGLQPEEVVLLDGSILNNKPLLAAIHAIHLHTAYREVDRRLIYIDPHPDRPNGAPRVGMPGFFATLRGALSDLPRYDPIYEELEETNHFNDQVRRLKAIIHISRPHVEALIDQATDGGLSGSITVEKVRHWRLTSTNLLSSLSLVYNAWMRSLVLESADVIADFVSRICCYDRQSQQAQWIRKVIEAWCEIQGMFPENYRIPDTVQVDADLPLFSQFIVNFGIKYKIRRISILIQNINSALIMLNDKEIHHSKNEEIDELKREVNECLRPLIAFEDPSFLTKFPVPIIRQIFCTSQAPTVQNATRYAHANLDAISAIIAQIGDICGLVGNNDELDKILGSPRVATLNPELRRIILNGYLGWPYWDVVMLPVMNALGLENNAFEEILVDRISPNDATTVCTAAGCGELQGQAAIGFGGFLSQSARENDYLWGRVHGIDRLIDFVASTFDPAQCESTPDFAAFKKRAFEAMLRQEGDRLSSIPQVVADIRAAVARL